MFTKGIMQSISRDKYVRLAFTLSEVLITLGVIGVVAALTVPTLVAKYKERQIVVQLKKSCSTLQQAFINAERDNGSIESLDLDGFFKPKGAVELMNFFLPYLKTTKVCSISDSSCLPPMYYYPDNKAYMNLGADTRTAKLVLADGTLMMFRAYAKNCDANIVSQEPKYSKYCAWILVDVNGKKAPNALGKDLFAFDVFSTGVFPAGFDADPVLSFEKICKNISVNNGSLGFGCTAWVIENENLDYLRCNNLSWSGAKTCKEAKLKDAE